MKKITLNGSWQLDGAGFACAGEIPGSVLSVLLENGLIEDPYYRDNELKTLALLDHDFDFWRTFDYQPDGNRVLLHCDGLDTLCDIYVNDKHLGYTDNMHRTYEFDVTDRLVAGKNRIRITFHSVDKYLKANDPLKPTLGVGHSLKGYGNLRKAICMSGWDWAARLPDVGIWRDIYLLVVDSARLTDFRITQRHENGKVFLKPTLCFDGEAEATVTLTAPDGEKIELEIGKENEIENPQLWWPNGLGEHPLYRVEAILSQNGFIVDRSVKKVGLRTLTLVREKDEYGESFCHEVNSVRFFAMGANYVPEDHILSRITPERTRKLLEAGIDAHYNVVRVWGGGYYPDDFFFDICDELGLVVFLDMMFACTSVYLDEPMLKNATAEFYDNLRRVRHHACLGVICGNNEIEDMYGPQFAEDYLKLFEQVIPDVVNEVCPEIPFTPSSPTSGGHFDCPGDDNRGDSHFWSVWGGNLPYKAFREHYFRYLSEFGFQAFPSEKTVNTFTLPEDRSVFSRIMEMHQRNDSANSKIISYLADNYRYPNSFSALLYASQLLQADAIRYGVEHLRRNRGRCMGTLYWQMNDIWPVASWASIDYFGRYKALHYFAKRFYNPVLISCEETGERTTRPHVVMERIHDYETKARLCVTNDTLQDISGTVYWELRANDGSIIEQDAVPLSVPALSAKHLDEKDFCKTDVDRTYLSYRFVVESKVVSEGTVLFTAAKFFQFKDPHLRYEINGGEITVSADSYAKSVEIDSPDSDFILSDNYFDLNGDSKTVKILKGSPKTIVLRSVYDIR